jgi:hypothetical protein
MVSANSENEGLKMKAAVKIIIIAVLLVLCAFLFFIVFYKKSIQEEIHTDIYRPVTVLKLEETDPQLELMLTGVVKSWKEEYFSFEVPGRLLWVIEKGTEIGGYSSHEEPEEDTETVIARIDPLRYQFALKSLNAKIESVEAKSEALKVSIQEVMAQQLEAIDANLRNAHQKFQRQKILFERNAVSRESYDNAETNYRVILAQRAETLALIGTKKAEYKALLAQVEELRQKALDAELNIEKCTLRTSYNGKIAEVFANAGANVSAGTKVVKIVVMNPILVSLEVSADIDRNLRFRDIVKVFPSGIDKPVPAIVTMKSTVADPNTHTFDLELFLQNPKIPVDEHVSCLGKIPEISGVWHIIKLKNEGHSGQMAVHSDAIQKDNEGEFVWEATVQPGSRRGAVIYVLKKHYVKLEPRVFDLHGIYSYRIFKDEEKSITSEDCLAFGVPHDFKDGGKAIEIARRWMFRPGDLAKVILSQKNTPSGIYVPVEAIVRESNINYVYKIKNIPEKHFNGLEKIKVEVFNQLGSLQRIGSPKLKVGDEVVLSGVHYIGPEDKVVVKKVEEIKK